MTIVVTCAMGTDDGIFDTGTVDETLEMTEAWTDEGTLLLGMMIPTEVTTMYEVDGTLATADEGTTTTLLGAQV